MSETIWDQEDYMIRRKMSKVNIKNSTLNNSPVIVDKVKQGKRNRRKGAEFERHVQADLENKNWICARWTKNVELPEYDVIAGIEAQIGKAKLINAKSNRFNMRACGFPDYFAFKPLHKEFWNKKMEKVPEFFTYEVIGIECKTGKYLDKEEKEKCAWLLKNNIFSKILVASRGNKRGEIVYTEILK